MGTTIRPELSEKNKYWIERHRYYELKHFCLQYPTWRKAYSSLDAFSKGSPFSEVKVTVSSCGGPTEKCAIAMSFYSDRISMVETIAINADVELSTYILKGVTQGLSYDCLKSCYDIPCCRDTYYDRYRRFFWLLNQVRD